MSDERGRARLTEEEVTEAIRRRKARTKWGALYVLGGFAFGVLAAVLLDSVPLAILGFGVSLVGAGFVDPSDIAGLWKR